MYTAPSSLFVPVQSRVRKNIHQIGGGPTDPWLNDVVHIVVAHALLRVCRIVGSVLPFPILVVVKHKVLVHSMPKLALHKRPIGIATADDPCLVKLEIHTGSVDRGNDGVIPINIVLALKKNGLLSSNRIGHCVNALIGPQALHASRAVREDGSTTLYWGVAGCNSIERIAAAGAEADSAVEPG